ncbi:MAG: DNA cytosine methyltransferase [Candidatus Neomarinimicrobiota bacterium]
MDKYTAIDLFAGCGGLSLGLEQAGFESVYVNELNNDALESYLINRDKNNPYLRERFNSNDVKSMILDKKYLKNLISDLKNSYGLDTTRGELTLLAGGPPCQGYSGIGHRRSYSVDKEQIPSNFLYQDMAFLISKLNPKIFLFENVRGLLSSRWKSGGEKGEIWADVKKTFDALKNYNTSWALVKAKDYGVPQNRPRVLFVGIRNDLKVNLSKSSIADGFLPDPSGTPPNPVDIFSDLIDPKYNKNFVTEKYIKHPRSDYQKQMRTKGKKVLEKGDLLSEQEYANHNDKVVERFQYMINNNGSIPPHLKTKKFAQRLIPRKWNEGGPNITATSLADDYVHYSQPRILTVREWARLQMFPDWYEFFGKKTTGGSRRAGNPRENNFDRELPKYTQIGNAVPVGLANKVGNHFINILEE